MLIESCSPRVVSIDFTNFFTFFISYNVRVCVIKNHAPRIKNSFGLSAKPFPPSKFALSLLSGAGARIKGK